jgi:hypothetical protein
MKRIDYLLEEKKFLESQEEVLWMQDGEWESRYLRVLNDLNAEEKRLKQNQP